MHVREDTFDSETGGFRVQYVENPRQSGFRWLDLSRKKIILSWVFEQEAVGCTKCSRNATAITIGRLSRGVYGLVCPDCWFELDETWETEAARKAKKGQVPSTIGKEEAIKRRCSRLSGCWLDPWIISMDGKWWCGQHAPAMARVAANEVKAFVESVLSKRGRNSTVPP